MLTSSVADALADCYRSEVIIAKQQVIVLDNLHIMTKHSTEKFRSWQPIFYWGLVAVCGVLEGLLLARLVARLFAARAENAVVQGLYALTEPLRGLLLRLDANQPQFGAVLELSTLTLLVVIPLLGYGVWWFVSVLLPKKP